MAVTKEQQTVDRELETVQHKWLRTYGWVQDGSRWRHPKLDGLGASCAFTTLDALAQTRADPKLGWPTREGSVYTARNTGRR